MGRPNLVVLLPARNCAADLPGYLESVERFADAVVALNDGSTDTTGELLAQHPLVETLLENPERSDYQGWDDAGNRNRLLAAAGELEPEWILSLDADERVDQSDAEALLAFIDGEADPSCGYLLQVVRMLGDLDHCARAAPWVGRLFGHERGQRFPSTQLHHVALPTSIPRERWRRTTIRIQHLARLTEQHRGPPERWRPRPPELPALWHGPALPAGEWADESAPVLSVVVISRDDDGPTIQDCVRSVVSQQCPWPFETVVVTSGRGDAAGAVRAHHPEARLIELPGPALPGEARNAGLRAAVGRYVVFVSSNTELAAGGLAARGHAHELGYAMVAGVAQNGTPTRAGWASYFLDHCAALPGRPPGELDVAPGSCSYLRGPLSWAGGFPNDVRAGEDTTANWRLFNRGYGAYLAPDSGYRHNSRCSTPSRLLQHHFERGRSLPAARRRAGTPESTPRRFALFLLAVPLRVFWTTWMVRRWGAGLRRQYVRSLPLVVAGAAAWWLGCCWQLALDGARRAIGKGPSE